MPYGCSACVCVAIEARRETLLHKLLARRDVQYRDIFWAPKPHATLENHLVAVDERLPQLFYCAPRADLSFVGGADCGHMQADVELAVRPDFDRTPSAYILVSVPMFAKWHSTPDFDAERVIRMSDRFDFSAPQFFHVFLDMTYERRANTFLDDDDESSDFSDDTDDEPDAISESSSGAESISSTERNIPGPLQANSTWRLRIWFEEPTDSKPAAREDGPLVVQRARRSCDRVVVEGKLSDGDLMLYKSYCTLHSFFSEYTHWFRKEFGNGSDFQKALKKMLQAGADLNHCFTYKYLLIEEFVDGERQRYSYVCSENICTHLCTLMSLLYKDTQWIYQTHQLIQFLLRNGLSLFLGDPRDAKDGPSLLDELVSVSYKFEELYQWGRGIAAQLLALGYGRRELHPSDAIPFDEHLDATRRAADDAEPQWHRGELRAFVARFDSGPLSLTHLARIAVRRAVEGGEFARRIRRLSPRLPRGLFKFVSDPTELMLTEKQLRGLLGE